LTDRAHSRKRSLLFIQPRLSPTDEPLIDDLTLRMTSALRRASTPDYRFCGVHVCLCGARSDSANRVLPSKAVTNTLCVHYLAYHRAEVPVAELNAVGLLSVGTESPTRAELGAPEYRVRRRPANSVLWGVDDSVQEDVDEENYVVRWRYILVLNNRSSLAACVRQASFVLSLDAVYSQPEFIEAGCGPRRPGSPRTSAACTR
jgi:hypothetical protein